MSEKIEKELLKILKNQEKTLKNHEKIFERQDEMLKNHEIILKSQDEMLKNHEKIFERQDEMLRNHKIMLKSQDEMLKNHEKMFKRQEKFNKEFRKELNEVKGDLASLNNKVENIEEKLDYVSTDLRNFSQHFAVFEYEFSRKVDVLFENYGTDYNEHKEFKKDINSLKDESFKHDVQIENLSKKIATV